MRKDRGAQRKRGEPNPAAKICLALQNPLPQQFLLLFYPDSSIWPLLKNS